LFGLRSADAGEIGLLRAVDYSVAENVEADKLAGFT